MSAAEVEAYIAAAQPHFRTVLQDLRAAIQAHLDGRGIACDEVISYGMPGFRLSRDGKPGPVVAGFAAHKHRCGFYPHSGKALSGLASLIGARGHTRGALHFTAEDPIPQPLLAAALDARLREAGAL